MISYLEALACIRREGASRRLSSERVETACLVQAPLAVAVLAETLRSSESVPEFDNSAVDGFALRSVDLVPGRQRLPVRLRALPGECPKSAPARTAVQIMTGAPMPTGGFDLLLKVEDVLFPRGQALDPEMEFEIEFDSADASPEPLRKFGTDYRAGDPVADAGQRLDSPMLLALGALGIREVSIYRKPKVWIISTGNELVDAFSGKRLPGQIRNSTAPFLEVELARLGCEVRGPIWVSDEITRGASSLESVLRAALAEGVDLVISTGAVSMGVHDIVKEGVLRSGGVAGFHHAAIRPGKPVLFATFPDHPKTLFLGLPGNPISTLVGVEFFVKPCLRALRGQEEPVPVRAVLAEPVKKPKAMRCFFKARWGTGASGESRVEIVPGQASFMVHSLRGANAWAILPEGVEMLPRGAVLEVLPFS